MAEIFPFPPRLYQQQQPPQPQHGHENGTCYACMARVLITPQKTCRFCGSEFVEIEETRPAPGAPFFAADATFANQRPPAPAAPAPAVTTAAVAPPTPQRPLQTPPTPLPQAQAQAQAQAQVVQQPPRLAPVLQPQQVIAQTAPVTVNAPAAPPARPKRTYTRRSKVNQPLPPEAAQVPGTSTSTAAQVLTTSPGKGGRPKKRPMAEMSADSSLDASKENSPRKAIEYECKICFEVQSDCVFLNCHHMCACYKCGLNVQQMTGQCPICRKAIERVILVFRA